MYSTIFYIDMLLLLEIIMGMFIFRRIRYLILDKNTGLMSEINQAALLFKKKYLKHYIKIKIEIHTNTMTENF